MGYLTGLLLDLLFPKTCVGCGKYGIYFCPQCVQKITQTDLVCPRCERLSLGGLTHPVCRRRFGLDGLWFLGAYQDPLKAAVKKLKYKHVRGFARELVEIVVDYWARNGPFLLDQIKKSGGDGWLVVPVPLHVLRQNWRGFNQSAEVGTELADSLGLEYAEVLARVKNTTPQVKLPSAASRRKNIRGAFALRSLPGPAVQGKNVILVDDVWTTGATLKECGFILKRAGAKTVWALTLAR